MQQCAQLSMKGKTNREIGTELDIPTRRVTNYLEQWQQFVIRQAEQDTSMAEYFTNKVYESLEHYKLLEREAWETVEFCDQHEIVGQKISAMKLVRDIQSNKDKLLQMTGAKEDTALREQFQRAQEVNQILSSILREVSAACDHCRQEVRLRLTDAFAMMGSRVEPMDEQFMQGELEEGEE